MKTKLFYLLLFSGIFLFNSCKDEEILSTDLTATITASDLSPVIGTNVTFTIVAHNNGPDNATGVDVTDNLPTGYTVVSATPTAGSVGATAWTIGSLANGKSETLTIVATVLPTGFYPYTVSILGLEADPSTLNNSGLVTLVPKPAPPALVTYTNDIKPIFLVSCKPCHIEGGTNPNKWDQYAQAKAKISGILDRVQRTPGSSGFMPKVGAQLSDTQISTLKQWVTDGLLE